MSTIPPDELRSKSRREGDRYLRYRALVDHSGKRVWREQARNLFSRNDAAQRRRLGGLQPPRMFLYILSPGSNAWRKWARCPDGLWQRCAAKTPGHQCWLGCRRCCRQARGGSLCKAQRGGRIKTTCAASFDADASEEAVVTAAGLRPKTIVQFRLFEAEEYRNESTGAPQRPPAIRQRPLKEVVCAGEVHSLVNVSPRSCLFRLATVD